MPRRAIIISSQRYLDAATVAEKKRVRDFEILVSPEFVIDGIPMRVLLDGHHSYAAAKLARRNAMATEATNAHHDAIQLLESKGPEYFLDVVQDRDDWFNLETGELIW